MKDKEFITLASTRTDVSDWTRSEIKLGKRCFKEEILGKSVSTKELTYSGPISMSEIKVRWLLDKFKK